MAVVSAVDADVAEMASIAAAYVMASIAAAYVMAAISFAV
jgi:hypothetical protein